MYCIVLSRISFFQETGEREQANSVFSSESLMWPAKIIVLLPVHEHFSSFMGGTVCMFKRKEVEPAS